MKYGTGSVVIAGAEAAPVCVHIGNVNPEATENMVRRAIVERANNLQEKPEELKEEQVQVEMVRRREEDPNPRTRAWKLTVPHLWREVVVNRSDFYPRCWSHRQWFNRSSFNKKEQGGPRGAGVMSRGAGAQSGRAQELSGGSQGAGVQTRGAQGLEVTTADM